MNRSHPVVFWHASRNPLVLAATTLAVVAAVLLPIASAHAVTYTVCGSACDYTTVQAAIDAAGDGDTLSLMDPVQNESNIQVDKNVTIQGRGAASTSVDGGGSGAVFTVAGNATFQDLTITGGAASSGAAIATTTTNNGIVQVINCVISGNVASSYGGGISNNSTRATIEISDSTISNNSAVSGDAGGIFSYGPLTISGSTISDNNAGNAGGGIVTFSSGILTIVNSTISNNMAGGYSSEFNPTPYAGTGGGVFSYAAIEVTNRAVSRIKRNTLSVSGDFLVHHLRWCHPA